MEKQALILKFFVLLTIVIFLCPINIVAQEKQNDKNHPSANISELKLQDTLKTEGKSFFEKIKQAFRFRDNKRRKQEKLISTIIDSLVKKDSLKIVWGSNIQFIENWEKETIEKWKGESIEITKLMEEIDGLKKSLEAAKKPEEGEIKASQIELSAWESEKPKGFFNKIWQPFRFKSNREKKEQLRIHKYIDTLIKVNTIKIDSSTVLQIEEKFKKLESEIDKEKDPIGSSENDEEEPNALTEFVALKEELSSNIQGESQESDEKKEQLLKTVSTFLSQTRNLVSLEHPDLENDSLHERKSVKNGKNQFKLGLKPEVKIIGWHNVAKADNSKKYRWNYLSAINLYGYELSSDGRTRETIKFTESKTPDVIKLARSNGCEVYLTVHNKNPFDIIAFLNDSVAQNRLLNDLKYIAKRQDLQGVNIYFQNIPNTDNSKESFTRFIKNISKRKIKNDRGSDIEILITLPGLNNSEYEKLAEAYEFSELNQFVSYYLLLTDNLINTDEQDIAQSLSPLHQSNINASGTVASTIDYYADKNIPTSKLIMTISWRGMDYKVLNYLYATLEDNQKGKLKNYAEIIKTLKDGRKKGSIVIETYDPEQATAVANILNKDKSKTQIWYENGLSTHEKYKWALENKLGGISIRGIEDDTGVQEYKELWNVLATSLIKIDTFKIESGYKTSKPSVLLNSLKVFFSDANWAKLNELGDDKHNWHYNWTKKEKDSMKLHSIRFAVWEDSVNAREETLNRFIKYDSIYFQQDKVLFINNADKYDPELQTDDQYFYLLLRWRVYARIFKICFFVLGFLAALMYLRRSWLKRYPPEKKLKVKILRILQHIFFILGLFCLLGYLFFDPWINIGGDLNQWIARSTFFILLSLGILLGFYITPIIRSQNLVRKNMP